ncbi:2-oxoglutarate/2-oxoacid ferredoxin oxidoreductase, gamma subunit [Candidatus Syntrophocurvum alkaliphilum]|uniref:2-oxoglutarate/2-oxoacid ferredoxin oxidoreductase, gamma subunit n=1 Tax=Candidatus Syntrophocurvum alkaliphilum TaxID=2293317 RepID=A0A6I6DC25_9FIRM|nr:2-oxoacid:acceptor oxidoreductase family protein [Candidatus Syntrophocurvum alkaliphilum]QGT98720.1 2-oxoglutarate/2-oxoacid ferredoxin oxidoreductase, gamma subunit [Candidatus Syntrophocurvum alkaliphilum]
MKKEITFAGFGGQGVLTMGLFLANAGMSEKKKVSYVPAYGAEMRGGTANCTVIISDKEISSPVVAYPEIVVAMNHPSLEKFEPKVKKGGLLLVNKSLVKREVERNDITSLMIPTQELASEAGLARGSNMVMLGALLHLNNIINNENIHDYLIKTFKGKYLDKMPLNMATIEAGMKYVKEFKEKNIAV